MVNLLTALYGKFTGSALSTYVGGRVYLDAAPENAVFPYVVYFVVSDVPIDTFKGYMDDITIQFSLFSQSGGATDITTMYGHLKTLFDDCTFTITGSTLITFVRQNLVTMVDWITTPAGTFGVKHWAVDYALITQKT